MDCRHEALFQPESMNKLYRSEELLDSKELLAVPKP